MSFFEMEKWYFDILTPQGDFIVLYFAYVRFACFLEGRCNIQIAPHDDNPAISTSIAIPISAEKGTRPNDGLSTPFEQISMDGPVIRIAHASAHCAVHLEYRAPALYDLSGDRLVIDGNGTTEWLPLQMRSRVSGTIDINGRSFGCDGCDGYVDYVRSTIFPLRSPIDELYWGRIHHDRFDLTFTYATDHSGGKPWGRMFAIIGTETSIIDDFTCTGGKRARSESLDIEYPASCHLQGRGGSSDILVHIVNLRNAIESRFIDQQDFGKGIKNRFLLWISRNPRGIKFIGRANVNLVIRDSTVLAENIPCIYEYVRFD